MATVSDHNKPPVTSGHEHMVAIDDDNDAGYVDPITLRSTDDGHDVPVVTSSMAENGHGVNLNPVNEDHKYILHHSKTYKYTQNVLNWIDERIKCLLNWIISISAIVSMILKLPFFVFLTAVILDLVKQRLKAKAAAAKVVDGSDLNKPYEEEVPTSGQGQSGQCK